ncbi:aminopeptidase [Hathewaya histolytica]|uniref:Aminopeptidase n=1 Tax=Hathewaya histolytica TaxID=1498 RepID=A0A4U9RI91_HATHI|nr:aminopeptidase [Hathewaya histolytica]VTQ90978.1 aminopeptidase [Hathewaya histolytica]
MNKDFLKKYADLAVKSGVNIQKGQKLVINTPIECAEFSRMIAEVAYEVGAKDVVMNWSDEKFSKIRFMKAPDEVFESMPDYERDLYIQNVRDGAAFLSIHAADPELMKDVDPNRLAAAQKTRRLAIKEFNEKLMSNQNAWSVISVPTAGWAKKVFPGVSEEEAIERLWESIFKIVRVDRENPVNAWEDHKSNLKEKLEFLNAANMKTLHYKNNKGTDLNVELPEGYIFLGGSEHTQDGIEFLANMPTEEVFSMPLKTGVNGTVVSSKPLNYGGNLIDNFSLTFKNGRIVDFSAESGYDTLKHLIETDEGSHYLGEVALVPFHSPISDSNIVFYNTLYDENASCHFAIGKAYSVCIEKGTEMNEEELAKAGVNDSLTHVDFMVGTEDLNITATTKDGKEIEIFKNGDWAF